MYDEWNIFDDLLPDVNTSNHSSLHHKGRIELKKNDPIKEEPIKKKRNIWYRKGSVTKKKRKELEIYIDGKKHLSKDILSKISINHADFRGNKNPMFGKKHSQKTINILKKNCEDNRGGLKGKNNPMHGRKHTEDTKIKMAKKKNKPLLVEGKFFESIKEARVNIVISIKDLKKRIAEGVPGYKILDKLSEEELNCYRLLQH